MNDDTLVLRLKARILTYSTSLSGADVTAFLTPPKIIKPHQRRERPHPRICQRWAPSGCHFPEHSGWQGEPIHLSKCWERLASVWERCLAIIQQTSAPMKRGCHQKADRKWERLKTERANRVKKHRRVPASVKMKDRFTDTLEISIASSCSDACNNHFFFMRIGPSCLTFQCMLNECFKRFDKPDELKLKDRLLLAVCDTTSNLM